MCARQGAIVAAGANNCDSVFPGQNLQAAPVSLGQECSQFTTSPSSLTGKPSGPYALGPFVVELFSGRSFESVPAGVTRRIDQLPGRYLPTPATLCELVAKPAPRGRDYATTSTASNCSRTLVMASPALYRHGLLSKITLKKVFPSRPDSTNLEAEDRRPKD